MQDSIVSSLNVMGQHMFPGMQLLKGLFFSVFFFFNVDHTHIVKAYVFF